MTGIESNAAIEIRNLRKVYRPRSASPVVALDDFSLEVNRGEILGLLGPNGAGKSTLIKILSTLAQPSAGQAYVEGANVVEQPLQVRQSIAVVLQRAATDVYLSVWENLVSYGLFRGLTLKESRKKTQETVEMFGLESQVHEKCQDLSGGYQRRVQVAKTFLASTPILFLDEATTGMDPVIRRRVLDLIRRQAREGRTVFLATQILSEAEERCDRIAIINEGRLRALGDLHSLKAMVREVYEATVTFEKITPELIDFLRSRNPLNLEQRANTIFLRIQASEKEVLRLLSEAISRWPAVHVELSGASLEDVFVSMLEDSPESPERGAPA